jgi:hypothetical protein
MVFGTRFAHLFGQPDQNFGNLPNKKPSANGHTRINCGKFVIRLTKDMDMPTMSIFAPACYVTAFVEGFLISRHRLKPLVICTGGI